MQKKQQRTQEVPFDEKLILFKYFLSLLGKNSFSIVAKDLRSDEILGYDEQGNTHFLGEICRRYLRFGKLNNEKLTEYDENICRHIRVIGDRRGGLTLKYFQYLGLLFTEIYLDKYFNDKAGFVAELNDFISEQNAEFVGLNISPYKKDKLNKLCFMCATGSGKTLMMHINILQYQHYVNKANTLGHTISQNRIILLTPNEGLSSQHLEEFRMSNITAALFTKGIMGSELVTIIDIHKLEEDSKVKTVSVDEFEGNNLVLVDEGHKGLSGGVWYDFRNRLSSDGFSFEYSATFKQALKSGKSKKSKDTQLLIDEYGKTIIMDYSYKYFYNDGYGKEYRIYNLKENMTHEQEMLYLTGCLLYFYQQLKVFNDYKVNFTEFFIDKPLLVFVGNSVNKAGVKKELTDIEKVISFINSFTYESEKAIQRIKAVLSENTGLTNQFGKELFWNSFLYLQNTFHEDYKAAYHDAIKVLFSSEKPGRLYVCNMKLVPGEISLKIGQDGDIFGIISIGDTAALVKSCELRGIVTQTNEFDNQSLFKKINEKSSPINILIGSRKFTEGWNSWRVSTMGLINFAKGEGSQAIQLFGRGVRLRGYKGCLKRSRALQDEIVVPRNLDYLEKLTIFGIKADYMSIFKDYLEKEDLKANDNIYEIKLSTISRFNVVRDKGLKVLRLQEGINFKKQGERLILSAPTEDFEDYILKNKVFLDCYSKVQSLVSTFDSYESQSMKKENNLTMLSYLDYSRIYFELQRYKNEKGFYNISIDSYKLKEILQASHWYSLLIPSSELRASSMEDISRLTDVAIMLLKRYIDKYFRYYKSKWESPYLQYDNLSESDNNFVGEYVLSYDMEESLGESFEEFIEESVKILNEKKYISDYERSWKCLSLFDFKNHLYAPLLRIKEARVKIEVSPVSLTESEKIFVDLLNEYVKTNKSELHKRELFLLRNKSKTGIGFFEAGGFYPDFIMWIIDGENQYVNFIDPKGIMLLSKQENNPKILFYSRIKGLQRRLESTNTNVILNSFVLSITSAKEVQLQYNLTSMEELEDKNVLFLEDGVFCIEKMIKKILLI